MGGRSGRGTGHNPSVSVGIVLIVAASGLLASTVLLLRTRLPARAVVALLSAEGMLLASGALLVVGDAGAADWVVALAVAAVASPVHVRFLLGPLGSTRPRA